MYDEVQLMRAGMTCQQTTAETLKKVCEETVFRMDVLESKTTQHVNNISEGCQLTVDLHPVVPSVDSAHAPVPVKSVNSTPEHVNHTLLTSITRLDTSITRLGTSTTCLATTSTTRLLQVLWKPSTTHPMTSGGALWSVKVYDGREGPSYRR